MPRVKAGLNLSEYAVLGAVQQGPAYGYKLQRLFSGDSGLARVCPIEPAMVYAILKSLSGLELIDGEWDTSQYPPKAVYTATAEGEAAFEDWLQHPVTRMREVRSDFLVKLFFMLDRDAALARELAEAQVGNCARYLVAIEDELASAPPGSFDALVLRSKWTAAKCTKEWLQEWLGDSSSP